LSLPKIKIGIVEKDWHGVPVLDAGDGTHYISVEDVAFALKMPVTKLCKKIGPPLQRARAAGPEAWAIAERRIREAAPLLVET